MKTLIAILLLSVSLTGIADAHDGYRGYVHDGGWRHDGRYGWGDDRAWWFGATLAGVLLLPRVYYVPVYAAPPIYSTSVIVGPSTTNYPGTITYGPTTYYNGYGPNTDR